MHLASDSFFDICEVTRSACADRVTVERRSSGEDLAHDGLVLEELSGSLNSRSDGAPWDVQCRSDLITGITLDPQRQHFPLLLRQATQLVDDRCTGQVTDGHHFSRWRYELRRRKSTGLQHVFEAEARTFPSLTVTGSVEGQIADDLHQPGLERATKLTEVVSVLPDASERLADDLLNEVVVRDQLPRERCGHAEVSLHQHRQCIVGVGRNEGHQLVVRQVLQFRFLDGH